MTISIIVPCFNEEESLPLFYSEMEKIKFQLNDHFEYIFVNDGSKDRTLQVLRGLNQVDKSVHYLSFSRNFGKEAALYAGLKHATGDLVTVMDADLQDPPELLLTMKSMLEKNPDLDCVGTRRTTRDGEPPIRSFFAKMFYKLINKMGGELVYNHADYRLMSKRALKGLLEFDEVNIFLRGMVPMVGYQSDIVTYERAERFAGESKYPLKKMLSFAFEGITSLSVKPIKMIFNVGILICIISVLAIIYCLVRHFTNNTVSGWTSLVMSIWFLGGLQLIAIGMVGQYIGKIYLETKARPKFIIEQVLND